MADFRKWVLALAVAALFLSAVPASAQFTPSAQQMVCTTFAEPRVNRSEGIAELQGDIVLNCSGGTPTTAGGTVPTVNIQVTLNTNVTSNLVATGFLEAAMVLDNPTTLNTAQATSAAPSQTGCGGASGCSYSTGAVPNVFLGRRIGDSTVLFAGIPIDPPGTQAARIVRITNVRANVAKIAGGQVLAFLNSSPAGAFPAVPITNASVVTSSSVRTMTATIRNNANGTSSPSVPAGLPVCAGQNTSFRDDPATAANTPSAAAAGAGFVVRFTEDQVAGFKAQASTTPGVSASAAVESGTVITTIAGATGVGSADNGTRLRVVITNIPTSNVRVFASTTQTAVAETSPGVNNRIKLTLINTDVNGANTAIGAGQALAPFGVQAFSELTVNNGTAVAVYEVGDNDAAVAERADVRIVFAYSSNRPTAQTISAAASVAPVSTNQVAESTVNDLAYAIPRFVDSSAATAALVLNPCVTNLLFPFVTNQGGFDTGIAISNTTTDPFGTANQSGTCTLNYYGQNTASVTPPANTTQAVGSGAQVVGTLSGGGTLGFAQAAGFQGYMIAQCNFRYGHGFAFISDVGARNLAMGYLALVLDGGPRIAAAVTAESLAH